MSIYDYYARKNYFKEITIEEEDREEFCCENCGSTKDPDVTVCNEEWGRTTWVRCVDCDEEF